MKDKIFPLSHLVLYAKGWYKNTDNVVEDLKKILELDNYTPFTKNDVYSIICNRFSEFDCRQSELREVLNGITKYECWKYGYYTNDCTWVKNYEKLPEYDMQTAFIYYVLSCLRFIDSNQWNKKIPKWNKYPKNTTNTIKKLYEIFLEHKK